MPINPLIPLMGDSGAFGRGFQQATTIRNQPLLDGLLRQRVETSGLNMAALRRQAEAAEVANATRELQIGVRVLDNILSDENVRTDADYLARINQIAPDLGRLGFDEAQLRDIPTTLAGARRFRDSLTGALAKIGQKNVVGSPQRFDLGGRKGFTFVDPSGQAQTTFLPEGAEFVDVQGQTADQETERKLREAVRLGDINTQQAVQEALALIDPSAARIVSDEIAKGRGAELRAIPSAIESADTAIRGIDSFIEEAGFAQGLIGNDTTGLMGAGLGLIPGSDAADLRAVVRTLQSGVALDRLQKLKESGATLGAVSEAELDLLINAITAIDPNSSEELLRRGISKVVREYGKTRDRYIRQRRLDLSRAAKAKVDVSGVLDTFQTIQENDIIEDAEGNRMILRNGQWVPFNG